MELRCLVHMFVHTYTHTHTPHSMHQLRHPVSPCNTEALGSASLLSLHILAQETDTNTSVMVSLLHSRSIWSTVGLIACSPSCVRLSPRTIHSVRRPLPAISCVFVSQGFQATTGLLWRALSFPGGLSRISCQPLWVFWMIGVDLDLNKKNVMPDLFPLENKHSRVYPHQGTFESWKRTRHIHPFPV